MSVPTRMRDKRGFTMAELLVVVAIIAVLVAVAIPVFSTQLEKSRRAVDLSNSRDVVAALTVGYLSGDIVFPTNNRVDDPCVVILSTEKKLDYFASGDIKFQGNDWEYDNGKGNYFRVKEYLEACGITVGASSSFATHAQSAENGGWRSWAVILSADGLARVVSFDEPNQSINPNNEGELETWAKAKLGLAQTNIEKAYGAEA